MFFKYSSLIALAATCAFASPAPLLNNRADDTSFNPPTSVLQGRAAQPLSQQQARSLTNSKRLALGLPLMSPTFRRASRADTAVHGVPSGTPSRSVKGYIRIKSEDGSDLGYVSKKTNEYGEYGPTTQEEDALYVSISVADADTWSTDITTLNGPNADFPFLGAIKGFASTSSDIGPHSPNYQYLGGTKQTPPYSPPAYVGNSFTAATGIPETSESAIFHYDPTTSIIEARYINTDSSKPETYIGIRKDVLFLTGDEKAFSKAFGPATFVSLKFVHHG